MCFQLKTVKAANLQMQEFKRQFDKTSRLQIMPYLQVTITPRKDEKRADDQRSLFDFVMHGKYEFLKEMKIYKMYLFM